MYVCIFVIVEWALAPPFAREEAPTKTTLKNLEPAKLLPARGERTGVRTNSNFVFPPLIKKTLKLCLGEEDGAKQRSNSKITFTKINHNVCKMNVSSQSSRKRRRRSLCCLKQVKYYTILETTHTYTLECDCCVPETPNTAGRK